MGADHRGSDALPAREEHLGPHGPVLGGRAGPACGEGGTAREGEDRSSRVAGQHRNQPLAHLTRKETGSLPQQPRMWSPAALSLSCPGDGPSDSAVCPGEVAGRYPTSRRGNSRSLVWSPHRLAVG